MSRSGFVLTVPCPVRISTSWDMTRYVIVRFSAGFSGRAQAPLAARSDYKRSLITTNMSNFTSLLEYLLSFLFSHLTIVLKSLAVIFSFGVWASLSSLSPKTLPSFSPSHCCLDSISVSASVDLLYRLHRPSLCVFRMLESVQNSRSQFDRSRLTSW